MVVAVANDAPLSVLRAKSMLNALVQSDRGVRGYR